MYYKSKEFRILGFSPKKLPRLAKLNHYIFWALSLPCQTANTSSSIFMLCIKAKERILFFVSYSSCILFDVITAYRQHIARSVSRVYYCLSERRELFGVYCIRRMGAAGCCNRVGLCECVKAAFPFEFICRFTVGLRQRIA